MKVRSIVFALSLLLVGNAAMAQETKYDHWSVGVKGGVDGTEFNTTGSLISFDGLKFSFGADVEFMVNPLWGLGLDYTSQGYERNVSGRDHEVTVMGIVNLANLLSPYRQNYWQHLNVYARLGIGSSYFNVEKSGSTMVVPLSGAIDYELCPRFTVGLLAEKRWHLSRDMGYLHDVQVNGARVWGLSATVRYKFGKAKHVRDVMPGVYFASAGQLAPMPVVEVKADTQPVQQEVKVDTVKPEAASVAPSAKKVVTAKLPSLVGGFGSGKVDVSFSQIRVIYQIVSYLNENPEVKLRLVGYSDVTGGVEVNDGVSLERAESVKQRLVSKGIDADRIITEGAGYVNPIASNDTEKGRQKNRRVEVLPLM